MTDGRQYQANHRAALTECEARLEARDREIDELRTRAQRAEAENAIFRSIAPHALDRNESEFARHILKRSDEVDQWPDWKKPDSRPKPQQAHGDALAALDRTQYRRWKDATGARGYVCGDVPIALLVEIVEAYRHLTASGVPEGWKWQTQRDVTDEYFTSLIAPDGTTVYVGEDDKAIAWLERLMSANSGVPKGDYHEGFEEGMRAGHGVPEDNND